MISYNEAIKLISENFSEIRPETDDIPLEKAINRTLAEDIFSDINQPPFDNSAVDGFAIVYNENIVEWTLIGEISAGNFSEYHVDVTSAVGIMTGAKIPASCDSIIPIEDIEISGSKILLKPDVKIKRGMNIRKAGTDIFKGELVIPRNTLIRARHLAAIASCGKSIVKVFKRLRVAILATGDELIPIDKSPSDDKIRVSNNYSLSGIVSELNQLPINYGFVNDNKSKLKDKLYEMLHDDTNIIITTGGVSVGKYDYVKELFLELGVKEIFWRAYIKPGKPAFFGAFELNNRKKLVFGLPGNPVSSLVNFEVYLKPFIQRLYNQPESLKISASLENDINKKDNKRHFVRAFLQQEADGKYKVLSQISQSSGNLVQLSKANCLIEIEEDTLNPRKGDFVRCILM